MVISKCTLCQLIDFSPIPLLLLPWRVPLFGKELLVIGTVAFCVPGVLDLTPSSLFGIYGSCWYSCSLSLRLFQLYACGSWSSEVASDKTSELSPHQISTRTAPGWILHTLRSSNLLVTPASRLGSQVYESSTAAAGGLSPGVHHQVHSRRHRRRRGTIPAHAGESATTALRLYGAVATAYPSAGVPLLRPLPHRSAYTSRGGWYRSAASAGVQPRTPFPSFCPSGCTLLRLVRGSWLAGGLQRA